jgi:hypothetical protein
MTLRRTLRVCLFLLGPAVAPTVAMAQSESDGPAGYPPCSRQPGDPEVTAAKGAYQAGKASFDEAEYSRAIDYWEDAFRRDCTALLLLVNLSRAYELNEDPERGVVALETYLARNPGASDRDQLQRRLDALQLKAKSKQQSSVTPASPPPAVPASPPPTQPVPPQQDSPPGRPLLPLYVAAGGAVLSAGSTIYYFASAAPDLSHYENICGTDHKSCPSASDASSANSARTAVTISNVLTGVGLATAVGGVAWYFLQPSAPATRAARLEVTPLVGRATQGLLLQGTF